MEDVIAMQSIFAPSNAGSKCGDYRDFIEEGSSGLAATMAGFEFMHHYNKTCKRQSQLIS
jgi:hypothetical protein